MENILSRSKEELLAPLSDARRKLLIILNSIYVIMVPVFLISEKITTGRFVNDPFLLPVYGTAVLLNMASALYNLKVFKLQKTAYPTDSRANNYLLRNHDKLDMIVGLASILPLLFQSSCNMLGIGNPFSDQILTDFALAQSLMIGVVIILGRKAVVVWFVVVMGLLFWNTNSRGWDYEYHYCTPSEVTTYKEALKNNETWALERQAELNAHRLNPPRITRYFNTWFVFIIVAFMASYYFSGITYDILKVVPGVLVNIEKAIENDKSKDLKLEHKEKEITKSAMRIVRYNEILEDLNLEIEKLDYKDKKNLIGIINKIRKALNQETDWETFETKFDTLHNDFFKIIYDRYPNLSNVERKHLAYIRMNLSSSEIANLMSVKMESLRSMRYRLKRKLDLGEDIDLKDFICNIELIQ